MQPDGSGRTIGMATASAASLSMETCRTRGITAARRPSNQTVPTKAFVIKKASHENKGASLNLDMLMIASGTGNNFNY